MKKLFLSLIIFASCTPNHREDINCKYYGAIVYHVYDKELLGYPLYDLKYKGEIIMYVDGFDIHNGYKVGDTINKPCIK